MDLKIKQLHSNTPKHRDTPELLLECYLITNKFFIQQNLIQQHKMCTRQQFQNKPELLRNQLLSAEHIMKQIWKTYGKNQQWRHTYQLNSCQNYQLPPHYAKYLRRLEMVDAEKKSIILPELSTKFTNIQYNTNYNKEKKEKINQNIYFSDFNPIIIINIINYPPPFQVSTRGMGRQKFCVFSGYNNNNNNSGLCSQNKNAFFQQINISMK
eukprot:TRINITY_DN5721_c1_g1_i2.p1 TRINITY_DN5721_c1_g1~~TRINITY_DN5721_c1_g1_i2.p1  ORF type:complete len:211 (+),score=8.00 TRINITY_DN5721_c1_g1_i2:934-1566(+)